jgi:hypothetical protein
MAVFAVSPAEAIMGNALHKETAMAIAICLDMALPPFIQHRAFAIRETVDAVTDAIRHTVVR